MFWLEWQCRTTVACLESHCSALFKLEVDVFVSRLDPSRITELIAFVSRKEGRYSLCTQIGWPVLFCQWHDYRVGDYKAVFITAALQIADENFSNVEVVGVMAEGLHHFDPWRSLIRGPARVWVELFKVMNHRLNKM